MGAFILYKQDTQVVPADAEEVFSRKGFSAPERFDLGEWTLLLFRKVLVDVDNFVSSDGGASVFCTGTVVYRGLGYRDSLERLLADFRSGQLDQDDLIGNFCLLYWDGQRLQILTDRTNLQHVFVNERRTCLSTSFLAVLAASAVPRRINQLALCEKLTTGYVVSPLTLVEGIYQLNDELGSSFVDETDKVTWVPHLPNRVGALHSQGIRDSLRRQCLQLEQHFNKIDPLHTEYSGELGLSSGYDSRLILACSRFLSVPLALHTHSTLGVHDKERALVGRIADALGCELRQVATRRLQEYPEETVNRILADGLYYYDGRCTHNNGAFSETYTRDYRTRTWAPHRLTLNGLGGEVYRNYFRVSRPSVNWRDWVDRCYYTFAAEAIGDMNLLEQMHVARNERIAHRLGSPIGKRVDFLTIRRYYSEVRMPDSAANNNNAHNQLAFFHTPFFDPKIVAEGIRATSYIGTDGRYQSKLIEELSPALASEMSHYGHPLNAIPWRHQVKCWAKGWIPDRLRFRRMRRLTDLSEVGEFVSWLKSHAALREIRDVLQDTVLRGRFDQAMIHYAQRPTTIFVGSFLREFHHKISW